MPFSRENRSFTLSLIAIVVIALGGIVAFAYLSDRKPDNAAVIGSVIGGLCTVLIVQVVGLAKIGKVEASVSEGQNRAEERSNVVKSEIRTVKEMVESAEGMPRTPDELRAFIRVETPFIVRQTLAELRDQGWQPPDSTPRVQT